MDLMHGQELVGPTLERSSGAATVLAHVLRAVARAVATVQRRIEPGADAALASEKPMLHAGEVGKRGGFDHIASENPVGAALLSSPTASTRNKVPIWSAAIKRCRPASMARRCSVVARAFKVCARCAMPRHCRKSPCPTGP